MDSPPTSEIRFLDVNGQAIETPGEWTSALIELQLPLDQWDSASLTLQQRELPLRLTKLAGRACILADWPLANPGLYELRGKWTGGQYRRVVKVLPRKISPRSFEHLLLDLEADLPAAVAMSLQRMGALAGISLLPPALSTLSQQVNRVRRAVQGTESRPGLAAVLEDLAERPHQVLTGHELWVKADRARRPHPARIKDAVCRGYNRTEAGQLRSVLDTRVEHTFDVYENRMLRVFAFQVEQRLRALLRVVGARDAESSLADELKALSSRLFRAKRQAAFLKDVSLPRHLPTDTTMVLLNRPSYRAAFQGYIEFHKDAAIRLDEPRLDAPLENVPFLYQVWGTIMVVQVLLEVAVQLGYRVRAQRLVQKAVGGLCVRVLPDGRPAVVLFHPEFRTIVTLIPERTYSGTGKLHSISFSQRPDVAIEVESVSHGTSVYIFDPKYKLNSEQMPASPSGLDEDVATGRPQKVDIDKMHSYRDSIRGSNLSRAVKYAAILYPGDEVRYADDIEALHAYPGDVDAFRTRLSEVLTKALTSSG